MRLVTPPGVFSPRSDTWMLAGVLREQELQPPASVLDLCSGSGAIAIAAALHTRAASTAVDVSRRSVATIRLNARLNGARVRARRGDLFTPLGAERFDAIVSNPPYLPAAGDDLPATGPTRAWDAGRDGRALLDRICAEAPRHLRPGGLVLLIHSSVCGTERTLAALETQGLEADVPFRRRGPLGPLLSARAEELEHKGLIPPGGRDEEIVVVRGRVPTLPPCPPTA